MHVVQANLLPLPPGRAHADMLGEWHSLVDIAEIAASAGTRISVVQAAWRQDRIVRNGIEYHFLDIAALHEPERSRRLAAMLSGLGADLLHVHGLAFAEDACAVARRLPRLPLLCQDHADGVPRWWRRRRWRRWHSAVAAVSFTSTEQARPFIDARVLGDGARVFAIPESTSRFTPGDRKRARTDTGMHGDPCVAWVGHLAHHKDPLTVIDGVAGAASRLPGLQMWCAFGTAPLLQAVQARIAAHPVLADRVHLLGRLPHAQVEAMMRASDLFVSGSRAEGGGYALMEAIACGTTPVVTDIPAFRALTGGGTVGRLWPVGDPRRLSAALVDAALQPPLRDAVRAHFEATLSFAAIGRRWATTYAEVAARHARGLE
ncbi:MAG: glycosyltransferase [Lysobacteraceae bacterium]|nr:MAG: glycosyltransferase [Xanthomonadaceae bacterium]